VVTILLAEKYSLYEEESTNSRGGRAFALKLQNLRKENLFLKELLEETLITIWQSLTEKQKEIFTEASILLANNSLSLNKLSERLSERFNIPFSTIKWNLSKLRKKNLLQINVKKGDTKTKIELTDIGLALFHLVH